MIMKAKNILLVVTLVSFTLGSCDRFMDVTPRNAITKKNVFADEHTANAAILGLYAYMNASGVFDGSGTSIGFFTALSSDELVNYYAVGQLGQDRGQLNGNNLTAGTALVSPVWNSLYQLVYRANDVIEGVTGNPDIPALTADRIAAEATFLRGFAYFYLVNLYGRVPLVLQTDYRQNASLPRSPTAAIYAQIVSDLKRAQAVLPADYSLSGGRRIRANAWVATALLARVYLYTGAWANAEAEAVKLIGNPSLFTLSEDLNAVFMRDSKESIWQMSRYSGSAEVNSAEGRVFIFSGRPGSVALHNKMTDAFESEDKRKTAWVGKATDGENAYWYPYKYKATTDLPSTENSTVLRLAEQYLILAEAKCQLGKIDESIAILDELRQRAGLGTIRNPSFAINEEWLLGRIAQERLVELFTEWGHRWFDLKRTERVDEVLAPIKPHWKPTAQLYPIPENQLLTNPAMSGDQNGGY